MALLKSYESVQEFLNENEKFLLERELAHNLILGICYELREKGEASDCHFLSVRHKDTVMALSVKTGPKALIAGATYTPGDLKLIANYYKEKNIQLSGVLGETLYAEIFGEFFKPGANNKLLLQSLNSIKQLDTAPGQFLLGKTEDEGVLINLLLDYYREVNLLGDRSIEDVLNILKAQIADGNIFVWKDAGELKCMAAVLRRTTNYAVIGNVYTPPQYRGKSYATSCVRKLSEMLLSKGYKGCGLFSDMSNPAANKVYKNIGYIPLSEFSDIQLV